MKKAELIAALSTKSKLSKSEVSTVLDALAAVTLEQLQGEGQELTLPDIGKLSITQRAARTGRNPITGASVEVPAKRAVKFKASASLKAAVQ